MKKENSIFRDPEIPVYRESSAYALENGEAELYRTSMKANIACKDAIESAIRHGFDGMHLDGNAAKSVVDAFGINRVEYVLSATVQMKDWDGRFSSKNREWAGGITVPADMDAWGDDRRSQFRVDSHPAVLNSFIDLVREERALRSEKRESALGQLSALKEHQSGREAPKKTKAAPEASL